MKRIFVPTHSGREWQLLLAKPILHWKRGASAMTAAASWEASVDALPPAIASVLDASALDELTNLNLLVAIPEWETKLVGGVTTSKTDVLALCRNDWGLCVVAVEAKVNEDFGPLVEEKRKEAFPDEPDRLEYLRQLLNISLLPDFIRYQLLHRTASAVLTARLFHASTAVMLVQTWGDRTAARSDFDQFCVLLRAREVSEGVYSIPAAQPPALFLVWCQGDPQFLQVELPSFFAGPASRV